MPYWGTRSNLFCVEGRGGERRREEERGGERRVDAWMTE
jgi:hypothetical protein